MATLLMRRTFLLALKISISGGLLYLALREIDVSDLLTRINGQSAGWLALAALALLFQILLSAVRWQEVTAKCCAPLTLRQALRFNLIGTFFNQVLPSSIGGDAVRLWLLKNTGTAWRDATYSVFVDRALGLIALAVIVILSLPWSLQLIEDPRGRLALIAIDIAALGTGAGFLLLSHIPLPFLRKWWLTHHPYNCSIIANSALFSRGGPKIVMLSLLVHILTTVIAFCIACAIKAPIGVHQIFLLLPPVSLITMLPLTIAGWGVRETAMIVAFGYAGLPEHDGLNISLLFGSVYLLVGLLGGLVWAFSAEKAQKREIKAIPETI